MTKKQVSYWLSVIVIGVAFGFGLQFVRAWTEPTTAPPGGNVGAPINTGALKQDKSGSLAVWGQGGYNFGVFGKNSNTGTYGYLGSDVWGGLFGGPTYTDSYSYSAAYSMAPVFYDTDSNYYVNPNGGSQLNAVYANNWFRAQGDTGLYFQDHGGGLYMSDNYWIRTYNNNGIYTGGEMQATSVRGNSQVCIGSDCRSSWPSTSSADTLQTVTNRGWGTSQPLYTSNYMQAPVFYDANDSGYYVDPNGTSRMHNVITDNINSGGDVRARSFCLNGAWNGGGPCFPYMCYRGLSSSGGYCYETVGISFDLVNYYWTGVSASYDAGACYGYQVYPCTGG